MMNELFTPRNVAKFVAQAIVAGKTSQLTENVITDHTRFEDDDMIVDISGTLVGWYVSQKLKPVTDAMVDKTADFIVDYREKRNQRRNNDK